MVKQTDWPSLIAEAALALAAHRATKTNGEINAWFAREDDLLWRLDVLKMEQRYVERRETDKAAELAVMPLQMADPFKLDD